MGRQSEAPNRLTVTGEEYIIGLGMFNLQNVVFSEVRRKESKESLF